MDERYQRGKIYRLTCDDPTMVYYGSTITTLKRRLAVHNCYSNNKTVSIKMRDAGGLKIELLEEYPCNSKRELEQREQYFIDNNDCINKQNAFTTNEQKVEKWKIWRACNHKKVREYARAHYEQNKDIINEGRRKKYESTKTIN